MPATPQCSFLGDYIDGAFVPAGSGVEFTSINPAHDGQVVLTAIESEGHVDKAVQAARHAATAWRRGGLDARISALRAVQARVEDHAEGIAEAITLEMGKPIREARIEARSIAGKIEGVIKQLAHELKRRPGLKSNASCWRRSDYRSIQFPGIY